MRWRSLGSLALILLILAAAYYALDAKGKKSDDATTRVFLADEQQVERLVIAKRDGQIVVTREGAGWRLAEPVQAKGDKVEINALLHTVLGASRERTIEEQPTRLGEYGLDPPAIRVTLTLKGDKALPALLLGDKNPSGLSVYAKREDHPAVFLLASSLLGSLDRSATDLRDKTLLTLELDTVKRIELLRDGRALSLVRGDGDAWELQRPVRARADESAVRDLLWKIKDARVREFLPAGAEATRRYGLDRPDLVVALTDREGSKRLLLKRAGDPKVGVYALTEPGEGIVAADSKLLADLSKSPFDLRDRRLLQFDVNRVASVSVRRGGRSIAVARDKDSWKMTTPAKAAAQAAKVYDLLYALKELRYHALIEDQGADLRRYGLTTPEAEVELTLADGGRLPVLLLGRPRKDRLYAKLSTAPAIYAIDPNVLDRLPTEPDAWTQHDTS
jgi:hypothetical protein